MKTVLVTGGAGFVGTALCRRLTAEGHRVISIDNYFTGSKDNHVAGVEYREGHTKNISTLVPEAIDIMYHLGEYSRIEKSLSEPEKVFDLNIEGSIAVLEFWKERKCKLVYAGSSTKFVSATADAPEGRKRSPYSWAKASISELVANYGSWYSLPYSIVYFYNVYGTGERGNWQEGYGTVIETFHQCLKSGSKCSINGSGEQTRAFTHIDDTVDGILLAGEKGEADEYAISAKEVYSLNDVAKMFGLEVEYAPATKSSRSSGADDSTKLEALGWKQRHTLSEYIEGLKKTA